MRNTFKVLALLVAATLILSLSGCNLLRRSATPPLEPLTEEDDTGAMVDQAQDNGTAEADDSTGDDMTETDAEATPEATEEVDGTTAEPLDPTPTAVPTIEPSPTAMPTAVPVAPTAVPTTAPIASSGTHIVQPGENLYRIALKYGLTTNAVAQANNITNPGLIYVGQVLVIPSGGTPTTTQPVVSGKTYVVQPGDNLFRIGLRYGLDQYYLANYNGISNPSLIYVGQVISIP